jgi:hypothetical protein
VAAASKMTRDMIFEARDLAAEARAVVGRRTLETREPKKGKAKAKGKAKKPTGTAAVPKPTAAPATAARDLETREAEPQDVEVNDDVQEEVDV